MGPASVSMGSSAATVKERVGSSVCQHGTGRSVQKKCREVAYLVQLGKCLTVHGEFLSTSKRARVSDSSNRQAKGKRCSLAFQASSGERWGIDVA